MKILELGMHFDPAGGGADRYFAGLLDGLTGLTGLASLRAPCTAAAFGEAAGDSRISLGPVSSPLPQRLRALRRLPLDGYDLLAPHFALHAWPLLGPWRRTGKPLVVHFHGPWADESAQEGGGRASVAAKRWIERRVYGAADRLIVLSHAFGDLLARRYGVAPEKIAVIPGGVDLERFRPLPSQACTQAEARERLGWPGIGNATVLLCVRRLVRRMGLEALLEAFAAVAPEYPNTVLVLGGRGPLAGPLQERARALRLAEQVRFAGFIPEADLPLAYAAADCTLVPSQALEGFGLIALESLACGTPVLVTPVGGLPEAVAGLDPSLVLADGTPNALADGLRRALSSGDSLPSRARCREYAQAHFGWSAIARRVHKVYQEARETTQ